MFFDNEIADSLISGALLSGIGIFWIILLVRIVGLRSFSKMTNFDFVMTVAMGSLLASAARADKWPGLLQMLTAMACLFAVQFIISRLRLRFDVVDNLVENTPVFLLRDGEILHDALNATSVSHEDLMAKLRAANVLDISKVRAVVLETTGDVSVLQGDSVDERIFAGVAPVARGAGKRPTA